MYSGISTPHQPLIFILTGNIHCVQTFWYSHDMVPMRVTHAMSVSVMQPALQYSCELMVLTISQARSYARPPLCGDALGMFSLQLHEFLVSHQWAWQCRPTLRLFNFACVVTVLMYSSNMHACMEWNTCKTVVRPKHMYTELGMCTCIKYAQVLQHSTCTLHRAHWSHTCMPAALHGSELAAVWNWDNSSSMEWKWMHGMELNACMDGIQCMEWSWMYGEMHGNEFPRDAWYWTWSVWDTCWWLYQLSTAFHCVMTLVDQDKYLRNDYQYELQVWLKWVSKCMLGLMVLHWSSRIVHTYM